MRALPAACLLGRAWSPCSMTLLRLITCAEASLGYFRSESHRPASWRVPGIRAARCCRAQVAFFVGQVQC